MKKLIDHNKEAVNDILHEEAKPKEGNEAETPKKPSALDKARKRHAERTEAERKRIVDAWNERKKRIKREATERKKRKAEIKKEKAKQEIRPIDLDKELERYDENQWIINYTAINKNGFVVTEKERLKEAKASKAELMKYNKEYGMCKVIAENGHKVEQLHGEHRKAGETYDIKMDGIKADLKCIEGSAGNIVKYAKKALGKQGAEAVIFEIPNADSTYITALNEASRKCNGYIYYYIKGENKLIQL